MRFFQGTKERVRNSRGKRVNSVRVIEVLLYFFQRAELEWDQTTKSTILASFFYGYIVTQIPGGWLADRYGGKRVLGITMTISAILTLLMPVCARASVYFVYAIRILLGLMTVSIRCYAFLCIWGKLDLCEWLIITIFILKLQWLILRQYNSGYACLCENASR